MTLLILAFPGMGKNSPEIGFIKTLNVADVCFPGGWEEAIYFYNEVNYAAIGIKNATNITWSAAIRITPAEMKEYEGWDLVAGRFYHFVANNTTPIHFGNLKIYNGSTPTSPGPLIASVPFNVTGEGWVRINLSSPIPLNVQKDLWIAIEITSSAGEYPIGADKGPAVDKKGDWLYHESFGWIELQDTPGKFDCNLNIEAIIYGTPPDPPHKPSGPTELQTKETGRFYTSTTDPDNHKIYYLFDWGDNTPTDWLGPYDSGERCEASHKWDEPGTYKIKVRAKDERNTLSNWSEPLTISVVNTAPEKPSKPSGPTRVRRRTEVNFTTNTTDFNNDKVYFMWDWGDNNFTGWLGPFEPGEDCTASHSWEKRGDYFVRVKAKDKYEDESEWSDPLEVKVRLFKGFDLIRFLERHPFMFPLLRILMKLRSRLR
jgi:hypothetical protein